MSDEEEHSREEEEDDDDQPPDFTSRVPLNASRRRSPRSGTSQASDSSWKGLHLGGAARGGPAGGILGANRGMGAKERALWRWINVEDLDGYLQQVYLYYVGKGIWAIALTRLLNLL